MSEQVAISVRTESEVEDLIDWCSSGMQRGSRYPGMSYEEGIRAALEWMTQEDADSPKGEL